MSSASRNNSPDDDIFAEPRLGLTAAEVVYPFEDPKQFDKLEAELKTQLRPESETERLLVNDIAVARWRLERMERAKDAFARAALQERMESDRHLAVAIVALSGDMRRLDKLVAAERRAAAAAWRLLITLQKNRLRSQRALEALLRDMKRQEAQSSSRIYNEPPPRVNGSPSHSSPRRARPPNH